MWSKRGRGRLWAMGALLAVGATIAAACGGGGSSPPAERVVYMAAIEPKGGVTVDKEPFPAQPLPAGDGYVLKAPDATGRWEVSTYTWTPGSVVVQQGDEVTLNIVGINGHEHPSFIEGYVPSFTVKRGELTTLRFTADKAGTFRIVCQTHQPSMVGHLVVLPR